MPKVFISYRRDDTSGEAGRLTNDLAARLGRSSVFIDVDAIAPGANFEERITAALDAAQVAIVLIGRRWLGASTASGGRRLDDEPDPVRFEVRQALRRTDLTVIPVLVDGAAMPSPEELPHDIALLAKLNAVELRNRRWRDDVQDVVDVVQRHDARWRRAARQLRAHAVAVAVVAVLLVGSAVAVALAGRGGDSGGRGGTTARSTPTRQTLLPAAVPSKVGVCSRKLRFAVDGTVAPLGCADGGEHTSGPTGGVNSLAWQYFANGNLLVMALGPAATPGRIEQALCSDLRSNHTTTIPKETQAYQLATAYYAWKLTLPLKVDRLAC